MYYNKWELSKEDIEMLNKSYYRQTRRLGKLFRKLLYEISNIMFKKKRTKKDETDI